MVMGWIYSLEKTVTIQARENPGLSFCMVTFTVTFPLPTVYISLTFICPARATLPGLLPPTRRPHQPHLKLVRKEGVTMSSQLL